MQGAIAYGTLPRDSPLPEPFLLAGDLSFGTMACYCTDACQLRLPLRWEGRNMAVPGRARQPDPWPLLPCSATFSALPNKQAAPILLGRHSLRLVMDLRTTTTQQPALLSFWTDIFFKL